VVKSGEFEVLERRQGINMRVNRKARGDCFGEVSLMYSCPRSATVAALTDAVVWVLERPVFRCAPWTASLFFASSTDGQIKA
jgi:cGMP-dependent protein kinase 2